MNVSLYKEALINIEAFLKGLDFPASRIICEGLVNMVNLISILEYLKKFFKEIVAGNRDYQKLMPATIGITPNKY